WVDRIVGIRLLNDTDDSEKYFVAHIFYLLRIEETYNGQVKLTEWILQMQNVVVLYWFLKNGGVMILDSWPSQAAIEEQTTVIHVIPTKEVAFSEGAHVNSIENTPDPHENAQGRSAAAEGPSLRRVRRPTAAARNRQRPSLFQTTVPDCNKLLEQLENKDPYELPPSLKALEGIKHIFQFYFDTKSKLGKPDFILDAVLEEKPFLLMPPHTVSATTTSIPNIGQPDDVTDAKKEIAGTPTPPAE
ncbi:hypothetical protein Tco_0412496, partial [Tanacetum coccineum]